MDITSRKFILVVGLILLSFFLVVFKIEQHEHWLDFVKFLAASYLVANVAESTVDKFKK